jgi:hypothetical protein
VAARDPHETREIVLLILGCVIVAVWVIAVLVQVAFPARVVPTEVHGVMLILVPILFGGAAWAARKQEK